jgi:hypothetical protein|tara:strand:+ start:1353 stop:1502 length:150 start_codon:yes stop_codon:yes gene_type:complete
MKQNQINSTIKHCKRLFEEYRAEQKEAHERRESEEERAPKCGEFGGARE